MGKSLQGLNVLALLTLTGGLCLMVGVAKAETEPNGPVTALNQPEREEADSSSLDTTATATLEADRDTQPATPVVDWQAQIEAVQITGIQVESTEAGLQVVIEADGPLSPPVQSTSGNALVLEIPNATLAEAVQEFEPAEGIALVQATALPGDVVQVAITGRDAVPVVNISTEATGLVLGVTPGVALAGADEDAIQLVVTGEEDGYVVPNATTATRTDTPLRDIPQSIQVIPQEVLEDQGVIRLNDALRNASGVATSINSPRSQGFLVRGFSGASILRDGFRIIFGGNGNLGSAELSNLETVEVLKGPTSILSGVVQPGGVINLVSDRPLREPFYEVGLRVGNRGLIEPNLDISGPLTEEGDALYRLNALYRTEQSPRSNFDTEIERFFIAPTVSIEIGERTELTLRLEYTDDRRPNDNGLVAIGDSVADIPFDRNLGEPGDFADLQTLRVGYDFEHRFSDYWRIRNALRYTQSNVYTFGAFTGFGPLNETTGVLNRSFTAVDQDSDTYELQTNLVGEFSTGSITHNVLLGLDLYRNRSAELFLIDFVPIPINIFNPIYGATPNPLLLLDDRDFQSEALGVFLQDQITLAENLKLLLGIRYESVQQETTVNPNALNPATSTSSQYDEAFIPRLGIVYQPVEPVSLYASYAESFLPSNAADAQGLPLEPERGQQFEVGVRAELLEGRLVANLALFDLTKQNVATPDLNNFPAQIAIGEQRSQGIELDIVGEILPGWSLITNYAYTSAEITESNDANAPAGNRLAGAPEHNVNLWTTYEIQSGDLEGLSFALGFNYVSDRLGDNANSFRLDDYFLTNAAIAYERDNWRAALNFRNLFDVDYIEASAGTGRLFNIYPGEGLTVIGSFSIEF